MIFGKFKEEQVNAIPALKKHEVNAIKAMFDGEADEFQQKTAMDVIMNKLGNAKDMSYRSKSERDTAFLEGRRFVGWVLANIIAVNMASFKD